MSFHNETQVKAVRKQRRCDGCLRFIEIGQPATRWAGTTDGEFGTLIWHPECRHAEIEMNRLRDWRVGDDWLSLAEVEADDHEWLIADHPLVAERLGLRSIGTEVGNG